MSRFIRHTIHKNPDWYASLSHHSLGGLMPDLKGEALGVLLIMFVWFLLLLVKNNPLFRTCLAGFRYIPDWV